MTSPNPPTINPGERASIGRVIKDQRKAIMVDDSALLYGAPDGTVSVFVVDAGKVTRKTVQPGMRQGGKVEIVSGLATGDRVVLKAGVSLREGEAVLARDVQPAQAGKPQ